MAFKFPFSTLHELNLDWILSKVKEFAELIPPMQEAAADIQQALDVSAQAVQTANDAKAIAEQAAQAVVPDGSITTPKLADGAVTNGKIGDDAVTTTKIQDNAITNDKIANNAVGLNELQAGSVGTTKLMDAAVTALKLDANAVTTSKITNESVTFGKLSNELQALLTATSSTVTITDPDSIVDESYTNIVNKWGNIKEISLTIKLSLGADTDYHEIGTIPLDYYPSASVSQGVSVTGSTIDFRVRSTDGKVFAKNASIPVTAFSSQLFVVNMVYI